MNQIRIAILLSGALLSSVAQAQVKPLDGVIDIHVHTAPDSVPRSIDAIDLARLAQSRGMRAVVFKNHFEPTASLPIWFIRRFPAFRSLGASTSTSASEA